MESLAAQSLAKLKEGEFKGAVRLATSEDSIAELNEEMLASLPDKHLVPYSISVNISVTHLHVRREGAAKTIMSFLSGSATGLDELAAGCSDMTHVITTQRLADAPYHATEEAFKVWKEGHNQLPPSTPTETLQKVWNVLQVTAVYEGLLETATDPSSRACLLAAHSGESGAWLHTLLMSSLCL